ncbi:hypothetical protein [Acinetobacter wuhouensis]|uniref:Uncharacterized protein n=1 Tax=Acinetobacter wuhouensis TaxID=1879050 RepID=A0A3G2T3S1_9GAMM|nr:hypothetical protein [Acinetobacter wuhouensis]AYO54386.1 hypothetical protein CDG68_12390 [Acinetobacter wuhouensis]
MTLYRDDIQETIAYSNNTIGKSKAVTEELIRIREDSLYRLKVLSADKVFVLDQFVDSAIYPVRDAVKVFDEFTGRKRHKDFITDQIVVSDQFKTRLRAKSLIQDEISSTTTQTDKLRNLNIEQVRIGEQVHHKKYSVTQLNEVLKVKGNFKAIARFKDSIQEYFNIVDSQSNLKLRAYTHESIVYHENYQHKKLAHSVISETVKAQGSCVARYSDFVVDHIGYSEQYHQRITTKQRVIDTIRIVETSQQQRKSKQIIHENLISSDINQGKHIAKQLITDLVFIEDDHAKEKQYGSAWTANVDTWAMSRYQDYGFSELVVIDGVLYGVAEDGVYQLDAKELIEAKLATGQLDLGQGQLVHPLGAYLEYELSGNSRKLEVGVSTTQSGTKQTYYYLLPTEKADYLTNGRVLFGRGLRGRHFAFEIKISGEHGYINDLNIDITSTKRRV